MQTPSNAGTLDCAHNACLSCKTRKRKCDKLLPKCSQCVKRGSACQYSTPGETPTPQTSSDHLWEQTSPSDSTARAQSLDYPTVLFLDSSILDSGQFDTTGVSMAVPQHVLRLLGSIDDIEDSASNFFRSIHTMMPFIPKKKFYDIYLRSAFQSRADLVLLFLALKLITTLPPTNPRNARTELYHTTKHFCLEVEGSSIFSVCVLQASVLIAFYELGHGIYPAAYLSIGACARYAHAIGITPGGTPRPRTILTLLEVEERRRVWWAIVILDRFVSIGCPGRPVVTAEPSIDALFPANDIEWDEGIVNRDSCCTLSSPMIAHMSRFSLLCQAARILGQVLETVSNRARKQENAWMQLDRTLNSMLSAALNVESPDFSQIAFIYSSLVALHTSCLNHRTPNTPRSQSAREILGEITLKIKENIIGQQCLVGCDPEKISPWGLFFTYQICAFHLRAGEKNEFVKTLIDTFPRLDARWNVAGMYMQLLEAQEIMVYFDQAAR